MTGTIRHIGVVMGLAATTVVTPSGAQAQGIGFEMGQPFPTLSFPALEDGRPRSIADFRGKRVILHVFASW
jgi:hypothetical protein